MKTMTKFSSFAGISIFLVSCFIISSACKKRESGWQGKIETIDGVKVVHNFEPDPEQSFKPIEFIVDLSIGEEEGDENYMFNDPREIDADREGNIYVLDLRDCTIKKYNPEGRHIKNIGRPGEGPGEFQRPLHLCISEHGNIFIADWSTRKVHVLNSDGEFKRAINVDRLNQISVTKDEELIIGAKYPEKGEKDEIQYFYKVGKYDKQKNKILNFYSQKQHMWDRLSDETFTFEFPVFVKWDTNSKDQIIIATADKYEMKVFTLDGSLISKYILEVKPIPVTGEAKRKISDILDRLRSDLGIDDPEIRKIVEYHPLFNCISIDEENRIWVERYDPFQSEKAHKEIIFDIFSSDGKFLFSTRINHNVYPQLIFKNGYIYTLARDESGYTKALRLSMREDLP